MIGSAKADTMEFDDPCIASRKVAPAAAGRAYHEIDAILRSILGQQRRLDVAAAALGGRCIVDREAKLAQSLADHFERRFIP